MNDINKYMLVADPSDTDRNIFILHTGEPYLLARVYEFDSKEEVDAFNKQIFEMVEAGSIPFGFVGRTSIDDSYIMVVSVILYSELPTTQEELDDIAKVMRQMADWYRQLIEDGII